MGVFNPQLGGSCRDGESTRKEYHGWWCQLPDKNTCIVYIYIYIMSVGSNHPIQVKHTTKSETAT